MRSDVSDGGPPIRADDLQEIVVCFDEELRITHWNRAGADVTGFSLEGLRGSDVASLFAAESAERFRGLVGILRRGTTLPGVELLLRTRYGHDVEVEVTGYVEEQRRPRPATTLVMRDVTLRNLLDQRRDRLERMFRTLVEHAPSMIYITDPAGRVEFANGAVERILGYAPRELRGHDLLEFVHPDDRERAYWPVRERRTGSRATVGLKVRLLRKQGASAAGTLQSVVCSLNSVGLYFVQAGTEGTTSYSGTEGIVDDVTETEQLREFRDGVSALLPVCSSCRRVRTVDARGDVWTSLEQYVKSHAGAALSHTYCPDCLRKIRDS